MTKPKRCKVCRVEFVPARRIQAVCGWECSQKFAEQKRLKAEAKAAREDRRATRAKLEAMQPLSYWVKQAQDSFNRYVRLRDLAAGHGCIDCGKPFEPQKPGGSVDAGHYLSRGSAPHLKFDERNVFAQRKNCNRAGGATRADFRAGVIARIGLEAVEALEADQSVKQYRADDLKAIKQKYTALAREIQRNT